MNRAAPALELTEGQRLILETLAKSKTAPHREVVRARVLLAAAEGVANTQIACRVGVSAMTVRAWRDQFAGEGLAKFAKVREGRGRKPSIPSEKIDEIVRLTHSVPDLIAAIEAYIDAHNNDAKPFVWTATAEDILEKVRRGRVALNQLAS